MPGWLSRLDAKGFAEFLQGPVGMWKGRRLAGGRGATSPVSKNPLKQVRTHSAETEYLRATAASVTSVGSLVVDFDLRPGGAAAAVPG
jgi:hypothetical protein